MNRYQFLHAGDYVKITLHGIPEKPGVIAKMSAILSENNINIMTLRHSVHTPSKGDIAFTVSKENAEDSLRLMKENLEQIGAHDTSCRYGLALVFMYGTEIENLPRFVSDILRAFSDYDVEFDSLSMAKEGITCILPDQQLNQAMHAFNKMFVDEPIISPV